MKITVSVVDAPPVPLPPKQIVLVLDEKSAYILRRVIGECSTTSVEKSIRSPLSTIVNAPDVSQIDSGEFIDKMYTALVNAMEELGIESQD